MAHQDCSQLAAGPAVLSVAVDYSKAFNRMKHSNILCSLSAINVPKCAIKLIKSYLTQRTMCIRYNGAVSEFQKCPGGGPQGGLLTCIFFILQVNHAGSPCPKVDLLLPIARQEPPQVPATRHEQLEEQKERDSQ